MNDVTAIHSITGKLARVLEVRGGFTKLSPRELEVVRYVLDGRLNKEIAAALGISTGIVKLDRMSIRRTLGLRSVVQLAVLAHDAQVAEPVAALRRTSEERIDLRSNGDGVCGTRVS